MKYAHINENNQLIGWYDSEIHDNIPTPNIEVTDEQWQEAINNNYNKINADGSGEVFEFRSNEIVNSAKWDLIRDKRNRLLAETDFYALPDVTMTTEMSTYRQQLRDLPTSTSNPDDVVFPTKPTT